MTGAFGKIGSQCVPIWEQSMDLRLTDLRVPSGDGRAFAADLTDFAQTYRALEGVDSVIHLAMAPGEGGRVDYSEEEADPADVQRLQVNVGATYNLLEAARRRNMRRVVYVSSMTILLGNKHSPSYGTDTPVEPTNLYACTKLFGEQLARVYWRKHGLSTICLRLGQPFPIGNAEFDRQWSTNKRSRSIYAEIGDVARAVECAVTTKLEFGVFPVVSASDNPRVDLSATRAIDYVPRAYLSDAGLSYHEDGCFPPATGPLVTHNPGELL